ncbi:transcriptional regulator [Candidatus Parcubacteria bacterium]|nr:transcriptional regulator [Candidatus Parcubacteria bacterium]
MFYGNPNRSFYVREITRKIDEQINSVRRELSNLLSVGIISSENTNNKLYYEVNQKHEHYKALASIFGSTKITDTDESEEKDPLNTLGRVDLAILTGQFTRDEKSGVDLLIVGDVNQTQLGKYVAELEKKEGKEIRYVVMTTSEFDYRRKLNDRFLVSVLESKKQVLLDRSSLLSDKLTEEEPQKNSNKIPKKEK